jgi:hypothetical protein
VTTWPSGRGRNPRPVGSYPIHPKSGVPPARTTKPRAQAPSAAGEAASLVGGVSSRLARLGSEIENAFSDSALVKARRDRQSQLIVQHLSPASRKLNESSPEKPGPEIASRVRLPILKLRILSFKFAASNPKSSTDSPEFWKDSRLHGREVRRGGATSGMG